MIKIFMGALSTGTREDAQVYALRRITKRYAGKVELVYPEDFVGRIFHDFARNAYVDQFMASGCDMLWFLDSDVVPPDNILDIVVEHGDKWKLAGAPYPVWMTPPGAQTKQVVFTTYNRDKDSGRFYTSNIPLQGTQFVDGIATGCIFIRREVLEKLKPPYFEFKYDAETRDMTEGEDLGFCRKVNDLGYQFFIDFGKPCHHYKKVSLLEVSDYMIEQQKQTVLKCEREFRQILANQKLRQMQKPQPSRLILPK